MDQLEKWTCFAPLDHPLRRAFVAAQTALFMEKTEPFSYDAKWKAETLRAMKGLLTMPGTVLFQFCRAFFEEVEKETGHQVLDPRFDGQEALGAAFSNAFDRWREKVGEFKVARIPSGRPRSASPALLVALVKEIRRARSITSDDLRLHADRHVSAWAAKESGGIEETFLREMRRCRTRRGQTPPSR